MSAPACLINAPVPRGRDHYSWPHTVPEAFAAGGSKCQIPWHCPGTCLGFSTTSSNLAPALILEGMMPPGGWIPHPVSAHLGWHLAFCPLQDRRKPRFDRLRPRTNSASCRSRTLLGHHLFSPRVSHMVTTPLPPTHH